LANHVRQGYGAHPEKVQGQKKYFFNVWEPIKTSLCSFLAFPTLFFG
jgi:hypothetical protein